LTGIICYDIFYCCSVATCSTTSGNIMFEPLKLSHENRTSARFMEELNSDDWHMTEMGQDHTLRSPREVKYEVLPRPTTGKRGAHIRVSRGYPGQTTVEHDLWFDEGLWIIGRTEDNEGWMLVRLTQVHALFPNDPPGDLYVFTRKAPK